MQSNNEKLNNEPLDTLFSTDESSYFYDYLKCMVSTGDDTLNLFCKNKDANAENSQQLLTRHLVKAKHSNTKAKLEAHRALQVEKNAENYRANIDTYQDEVSAASEQLKETADAAERLIKIAEQAERKADQAIVGAHIQLLQANLAKKEAEKARINANEMRIDAHVATLESEKAKQEVEFLTHKQSVAVKNSEIADFEKILLGFVTEQANQRAASDEAQADIEKINVELDVIKSGQNFRRSKPRR